MLALSIVLTGATLLNPSLSNTANAADALVGSRLTGRIVDGNGKPVAKAQIQLIDPKKTMMDVTTSAGDGRFSLDLGVLEEEEMANLRKFTLQIAVKGKKHSRSLQEASSSGGVVQAGTIELR